MSSDRIATSLIVAAFYLTLIAWFSLVFLRLLRWRRLAKLYPWPRDAVVEDRALLQAILMGTIVPTGIRAAIGVSRDALFLSPVATLGMPRLMVPWSDIESLGHRRLYLLAWHACLVLGPRSRVPTRIAIDCRSPGAELIARFAPLSANLVAK